MLNDSSNILLFQEVRKKIPLIITDGYFQNNFTLEILTHFKTSSSIDFSQVPFDNNLLNINEYEAAIHVRGSDFLDPNSIHYLPFSYYIHAVDHAFSNNITRFLIISDDFQFAQKCKLLLQSRFLSCYFEIYNPNFRRSALYDFILLSKFTTLIIGNSTFSWWASAISSSPINLLITPGYFISTYPRLFQLDHETVISPHSNSSI